MKFEKRFFYSQIPEWKDRYIDYNALVGQIRLIKKAALNLAKAYANIKAITGDDLEMEIKVNQLSADRVFWRMLDENVDKVEEFYRSQLNNFTEKFHILTLQAIRLGIIKEYVPFTRGLTTRLERELERLSLLGDIEVATAINKEDVKDPIVREGTQLLRLTPNTSFKEVIRKIRQSKQPQYVSSDDDDRMDLTDDEEEPPLVAPQKTHSAMVENYHNDYILDKQTKPFADTGGGIFPPHDYTGDHDDLEYDSDKSEEMVGVDVDMKETPYPKTPVKRRRKMSTLNLRPLSQRDLPELDRKETYQGDQVIEMQPIHTNHTADSNDYDDFDDFDLDDVPEHLFTEISGRPFDTSVPPVDPQTQQSITRPEAHGEAPAHSSTKPLLRTSDRKLAIAQLRTAFTEFYRGLTLLNNFARLNVEAIEKILKKHDKNIELGARERYMNYILVEFSFYRRRSLKALMRETEHVFAMCFTQGHRTAAMKRLRVPNEKKKVGMATFRFGLFFGASLAIFGAILYLVTVLDSRLLERIRPGLIMYRMLAMAVLMTWYWGFDMWVWTKYRVNYVFIFEFNPRSHVRYQHIFEVASIFTFLLAVNMLVYVLTAAQQGLFGWPIPGFEWLLSVPTHLIPLTLITIVVLCFIWYQYRSRWWLVRTLGRIWAAPFFKVLFRDFFIADQLLSLVIVIQDLEFTICYYVSDVWTGQNTCSTSHTWVLSLLAGIPGLSRWLQCWRRYYDSRDKRQLVNMGKYSTGIVVVIASALRKAYPSVYTDTFWILAIACSTIYTFSWDVFKDWSLGEINGVKHRFLRSELLYPTYWYYAAIVLNLGMRLMWTLTISPDAVHLDAFVTILAVVEITRRAIWNIFRLENEQLNNCGKFRALKDIPLPIPVSDSETAEN